MQMVSKILCQRFLNLKVNTEVYKGFSEHLIWFRILKKNFCQISYRYAIQLEFAPQKINLYK